MDFPTEDDTTHTGRSAYRLKKAPILPNRKREFPTVNRGTIRTNGTHEIRGLPESKIMGTGWDYRLPEKFQDGVCEATMAELAEEWKADRDYSDDGNAGGWDYRLPEKFQS